MFPPDSHLLRDGCLNAMPDIFHPKIHTDLGGEGDKNRQRRRIFCFSTRVLPSQTATWSLRLEAAGQAQHFCVGSGLGWWASILHPMPIPVHFYTGDAGDSDIALLNNQNVKVVRCGPPPGAALQMLPPGAELFQLPLCATLSLNAAINLPLSLCQVFQNSSDHLSFCAWEMY